LLVISDVKQESLDNAKVAYV